jgi:hypothetical protein
MQMWIHSRETGMPSDSKWGGEGPHNVVADARMGIEATARQGAGTLTQMETLSVSRVDTSLKIDILRGIVEAAEELRPFLIDKNILDNIIATSRELQNTSLTLQEIAIKKNGIVKEIALMLGGVLLSPVAPDVIHTIHEAVQKIVALLPRF